MGTDLWSGWSLCWGYRWLLPLLLHGCWTAPPRAKHVQVMEIHVTLQGHLLVLTHVLRPEGTCMCVFVWVCLCVCVYSCKCGVHSMQWDSVASFHRSTLEGVHCVYIYSLVPRPFCSALARVQKAWGRGYTVYTHSARERVWPDHTLLGGLTF